MSTYLFPGDIKDCETTYKNLVENCKTRRAPHRAQWNEAFAYMHGMRHFTQINYRTGVVQASHVDKQGRLKFVLHQIVANYIAQFGRLLSMDLSPKVDRASESLDGQRKAAIDQAVLSSLFPSDLGLKLEIVPNLLMYGTIGLALMAPYDDPKHMYIKVLMPWEIMPIPSSIAAPSEARGLIWRHQVPVEEFKDELASDATRKGKQSLSEARVTRVARADLPTSMAEDGLRDANYDAFFAQNFNTPELGTQNQGQDGANRGKTDKMDIVWRGDVFTWDESGYLQERLLFADSKLVSRTPFKGMRMYAPVAVVRDIDVGGFYAQSWVSNQIPLNRETEACAAKAFMNQQAMDQYGVTLIPGSFGINRHAMLTAKDGVRMQLYDHDGMSPGRDNVIQLQPFNSGLLPVKVVDMGLALMNSVAGQPQSMMRGQAPGRIDSASALGQLMETANIPIAPVAASLAEGVAQIYKAALCYGIKVFQPGDVVKVTMLTNALTGAVYDPKAGTISLGPNGLAHPDQVKVMVASMLPTSKEQQKAELDKELNANKTITPREYRIKARLLGLNLPTCNEQEWLSYEKARRENQLLFGDGENVPETSTEQEGVLFSLDGDMHDVHIMVHSELPATINFSLAAMPVRQRIYQHLKLHKDAMGMLPDGMPPIEDAAAMAMQGQEPGGMMPQAAMAGAGAMM